MANGLPIIVLGGGIGGTAAALALARKGRASIVLEQASDLGEIGAGIQMPPNAFKAFRSLGVLAAVQSVAAYPERLVLGDMLTGEPIYQSPIREDFTRRFGFPYALMHRGDLLQILVDACRGSGLVTVHTSARMASFRDAGDRVIVETERGDGYEGEAMIAADGLWSATRSALFGGETPRTDGYVVCRGVVPVEQIPEALYSHSVTMWGGPELDLFHYPLRRGEIYNIGASYRDSNLLAGAPGPIVSSGLLTSRFRDACPHVRELLRYIEPSRTWVLYDRPPIKAWSTGRVALLGDAAHPTTIYISQGACMALEDAVNIAEMIERIPDIAGAFRAYAAARYLRTARIQLTSCQFGEIYHASGVLRDLRNSLLAGARPEALCDALEWIFGRAEVDCFDLGMTAS